MVDESVYGPSRTEETEMRELKLMVSSQHSSVCSPLMNYDIEKALQIIDSKDWTSGEPFLDPYGLQRLNLVYFAACRGDLHLFERAGCLNTLFYEIDEFGKCPLHYAARQGHINVLEKLFELDAANVEPSGTRIYAHPQLSLADHFRWTALHEAVEAKHVEVVGLLVKIGASVNSPDENRVPPLFLAYSEVDPDNLEQMKRYEEIVDILVSVNAGNHFIHPDRVEYRSSFFK